MASAQYRIESTVLFQGGLLPLNTTRQVYANRSLAVAVAVKSVADPTRQVVRVVHIASGEVIFETAATSQKF